MKYAEHGAYREEMRNAHKIFARKTKKKYIT
jgi:hypothetical protein